MADQHPIQGLMYTAMQSIKDIVDVNTIVGEAVQTPDGTIIIPISSVKLGFAVGGSEYGGPKKTEPDKSNFGGGAGGGVSIAPVAFLVAGGDGKVKVMSVNQKTSIYDKVLDVVPSAIDKLVETVKEARQEKKGETKAIIKAYEENKPHSDAE